MEVIYKYFDFAVRLPKVERLGMHVGTVAILDGGLDTEFGNPILGGIKAVVGAVAIYASLSTPEAREALDNRGNF